MSRFISFILFTFFLSNGITQNVFYKEKYRPQFHFTSPLHWINDPNGLVNYKGRYHLFYQHNPMGFRWGHMSWGHAVSKDLVHWEHLPIAIPEENGIMIFSGTCVADVNNTSGLGTNKNPPMVAVYTGHIEGVNQSQHIAYSLDERVTWKKYDKNPVLDLGKKDFRDPKIFWYQPKNYWVMAVMLSVEHKVQFYSSFNLIDWKHLSDFGPVGDTSGVWECPDLTEVPIEGEKRKTKWLLQMSENASMQYFIGDFDGIKFINENTGKRIMRPDYGPDYYAAIAYSNLPTSQPPTAIGWLNNWYYSQDIPTMPWRGMMSIPRNLKVKKIDDEWLLLQEPDESVNSIRTPRILVINNKTIEKTKKLSTNSQQFELDVTLVPDENVTCGIRLASGKDHEFLISYNSATETLSMDRSKTGNISFSPEFEKRSRCETKLSLENGAIQFHVFFDNSVVELFANNGQAVMTMQFFPEENDNNIELFSINGNTGIKTLSLWKIKSCW